jgi:hypothetical protein
VSASARPPRPSPGRPAAAASAEGGRPGLTLPLVLKLFGPSHIYPHLLRRHSPFLPALPPPHARPSPYVVGYDEDTTPELAALSRVSKAICAEVRGFFFTGVHLCVDEEEGQTDDEDDDDEEREVYDGVPWDEVIDGLEANPRLREHVEFRTHHPARLPLPLLSASAQPAKLAFLSP